MLDNPFYTQDNHGKYEIYHLGDFDLTRGGTLPDCKLAYATYGKLNDARDNAILFPVMFSGTSGSLKHYVGKDLALDPDQYFIVIPNQLGNGISSSPHNTPAPHGMSSFPALDIADDVRAQHRLMTKHFGVETIRMVLGWSMGAQQTYEWAVRYPDVVQRAAPIAGTARTTPHDAHYVSVFSEALKSDPAWNNGEYTEANAVETGLRRMAHVFALMGLSSEFYKQSLWTKLDIPNMDTFLKDFWEAWFLPMDANALLCMADKWRNGDVSAPYGGDLAKALARITAKTCVIAFTEDMFIPVRDCRTEQAMIKDSTLVELDTLWGHFGMMGVFPDDFMAINTALKELLAR